MTWLWFFRLELDWFKLVIWLLNDVRDHFEVEVQLVLVEFNFCSCSFIKAF